MKYGCKTTFEERVEAVYLTIPHDKDHQGSLSWGIVYRYHFHAVWTKKAKLI